MDATTKSLTFEFINGMTKFMNEFVISQTTFQTVQHEKCLCIKCNKAFRIVQEVVSHINEKVHALLLLLEKLQ